jgi:ribosomal protein L27
MAKRKSNLCTTKNKGSKAWRNRMIVNNGEIVKAGSNLIIDNKNKFKVGKSVYKRKNILFAKIAGRVNIKNKKVEII